MIDMKVLARSIADNGLTAGCKEAGVTRSVQKEMVEHILKTTPEVQITPYTTLQQIVWYYVAAVMPEIAG